ncbi:MAG TPA: alpha/beta hydrolase [Chloroflexota bacterium]|jgi:pimeloyl-ACP methyl ester carboxylesterase
MPTESPRAQSVQLGDLKLHYVEWGDPAGPPMVLLHGFMAHARTWDLFARDLASNYRILAVDQRGHGDTGAAPGDSYTTDDYVGDVERFAAALGLTRFVLVGMSMGGRNSIVYAARHPEQVEKLIIVDIGPQAPAPAAPRPDAPEDPGIFDDPSQVADFLRGQDPYPPENYRQEVARHSVRQRPDGKYEWKWAPGLLTGRRGGWDTWAEWRSIRCPVLVVRGAESPVLPQDVAERMVQELPDARLAVAPRSGHPVQEDNAPALIQAVREFLAK